MAEVAVGIVRRPRLNGSRIGSEGAATTVGPWDSGFLEEIATKTSGRDSKRRKWCKR